MIRGINTANDTEYHLQTQGLDRSWCAMNMDDWLNVLRENGYRVTKVQETLVRLFMHTERPISADEAWEAARKSRPETGRATVFRTVEKLESLRLLRRVDGYHGCSRYLPVVSEAVLLFLCTVCGGAEYLDRTPLDTLVKTIEQQSQHHIDDSRLQLFGTCAECKHLQQTP
jgi:Fe2+ or Zn2+ uptake regulation protein